MLVTAMSRSEAEIVSEDTDEIYPLPASLGQERLWLAGNLAPGHPRLNVQMTSRLTGSLEISILRKCLAEVVRRHEILRTTFTIVDGKPVQVIHPSLLVDLEVSDLRKLPESERELKARECLRESVCYPFDISRLPLIKTKLLQLGDGTHLLAIAMPEIICDRWSCRILERELVALFQAYAEGTPSQLTEPEVQFSDFAQWQSEWMKAARFEDDLSYWKRQLEGKLPVLDLPADRMASGALVSWAETETLSIRNELVSSLKDFCKREQATFFMLLLAVFNTILYRYTGQDDILIGSPVAGRPPDTEGILGPFSYPICLRTKLSGEPTFRELIHRVGKITMEALIHKELPFARLLDELEIQQVQGRNPLFQFYFEHEAASIQTRRAGAIVWSPATLINGGTSFDLRLSTAERNGELVAALEYNAEMFEAATIRRMLAQFCGVLEAVVTNPEMRISELPMQTTAELKLHGGPCATVNAKTANIRSVVDLFEEQVELAPDAIVVANDAQQLSYRELNSRAEALAQILINASVEPGTIVGVCSQDPRDWIIGMLAVTKVGGAYLSLPSVESQRESVFECLGPSLKTVVTAKREEQWFRKRGIRSLFFDEYTTLKTLVSAVKRTRHHSPEAPACVRLTAGPAGKPAALIISHAALIARVCATRDVLSLAAGDRVAMAASSNAEEEIWSCLISGATLVLTPVNPQGLRLEFWRLISELYCSVLCLDRTALAKSAINGEQDENTVPESVRLIVLQGEPLPSRYLQNAERLLGHRPSLISCYGKPEAGNIVALSSRARGFNGHDCAAVVLDQVAAGFGIRILDKRLHPVPAGVYGEICVYGPGVCQGYLDRSQLTPSPFVTDPRDGTRLFRSGDLGRLTPDGRLEFQGSTRRHLNVDGFRLHLGALECALTSHPSVMEAIAVPSQAAFQGRRPDVDVVIDPEADRLLSVQGKAELKRELRKLANSQAPEYPDIANIVLSGALKRDLNGRVDLSSLEAVDAAKSEMDRSVARPRDDLESQLVSLWEEIFAVRPIGIHDNFFDLRGHSILALRLFDRIATSFKQTLSLATLYQAPTIEGLARIIRGEDGPRMFSSLIPLRRGGARSPLYIISGLGGNIVRFHNLARLLHPEQPVYALQPPGLDDSQPYLTRIEDMAAHYVRQIKNAQSQGPYFLAGYCFGGLVTFEMGRQLLAQGDEVALLALLDSPPRLQLSLEVTGTKDGRMRRRYRETVQRLVFGLRLFASFRARIRRHAAKSADRRDPVPRDSLAARFGRVQDINSFAVPGYLLQPYSGRITLFRRLTMFEPSLVDTVPDWRSLAAGGVEVHEIAGNHDDIIAEPNVRSLAYKLQQCLDRAQMPAGQLLETERVHTERKLGAKTEKAVYPRALVLSSKRHAFNG